MDHLSSCYFCGTAIDEPLQRYLVGDSETPTTVTLCPACSHKLNTVLETAGAPPLSEARVDDAEAAVSPVPSVSDSEASEERDTSPAEESDEAVVDSSEEMSAAGVPGGETSVDDGSDETPVDEVSDDTSMDEGADETSASPDSAVDELIDPAVVEADELSEQADQFDDSLEDEAVDSVGADSAEGTTTLSEDTGEGGRTIDDLLEENMEAEMPEEFEIASSPSEEGDEPTDSEPPRKDEADDESDDSSATDTPTAESESPTDETDAEPASTEEQSADQTDDQPQTTISALEYNKVMRLLQNREFPVERSEIETVAASAYSLSEQECAEVIDLAVDRDLLEESDGLLNRPS